jgi:hypothetical protein
MTWTKPEYGKAKVDRAGQGSARKELAFSIKKAFNMKIIKAIIVIIILASFSYVGLFRRN